MTILLFLFFVGVFVLGALITLILHFLFKKPRIIKYIPTVLCFLMIIYYQLIFKPEHPGLTKVVMTTIYSIGAGGGFLTGIMFDHVLPRLK